MKTNKPWFSNNKINKKKYQKHSQSPFTKLDGGDVEYNVAKFNELNGGPVMPAAPTATAASDAGGDVGGGMGESLNVFEENTKLTSKDKQELKKIVDATDDPETVAAYLKGKGNDIDEEYELEHDEESGSVNVKNKDTGEIVSRHSGLNAASEARKEIAAYNKNESLDETQFDYRYEVRHVSPDADNLLGTSDELSGAISMFKQHAEMIAESPWKSKDEKISYINDMIIIDNEINEEIDNLDLQEFIEDLIENDINMNKQIIRESSDDSKINTVEESEADLKELTSDFTEQSGAVRCYNEEEKLQGLNILAKHYSTVAVEPEEDNIWIIEYKNPVNDSSEKDKDNDDDVEYTTLDDSQENINEELSEDSPNKWVNPVAEEIKKLMYEMGKEYSTDPSKNVALLWKDWNCVLHYTFSRENDWTLSACSRAAHDIVDIVNNKFNLIGSNKVTYQDTMLGIKIKYPSLDNDFGDTLLKRLHMKEKYCPDCGEEIPDDQECCKKKNLNESDDGSVERGDSFIEDGCEYEWRKPVGDAVYLDFDHWQVWSAYNLDEDEVQYFVVEIDTGFIDWGPCDTAEEAQEFLDGKIEDYENE